MARSLPLLLLFLLVMSLPTKAEPTDADATENARAETPTSPTSPTSPTTTVASLIAGHVTDTTMTAMSPLLVVSAEGAWQYFSADASDRASLPWYTSPWLWGSLLGLGALFTINTAIGNALPLLKTPMNVIEEHENKVTGLLIGLPAVLTRLVPDLQMPATADSVSSASAAAGADTAVMEASVLPIAVTGPWAAALIAVPAVVACYFVVWLSFHTMHVIALVSPFGIVDTGLKFGRIGLLGAIAGLSIISPFLSVAVCLVIIVISYFIAGWSFRLTVFGTLLSWDLMLFRHRRLQPDANTAIRGFLSRQVKNAPVRSYGTLTRQSGGSFVFHYRPWLCMPRQSVELPVEDATIQRGIISPVVLSQRRNLMRLRPKFRGHEEMVASVLRTGAVEDHVIARGMRQASAWLRDIWQLEKSGRKSAQAV